jgi:HEPN domain-containing protein
MTDNLKAFISSWLSKADNDLLSAKRLIEIKPMILDNACFFCQQAIEKYLKAFLIYNEQDIIKTHNIHFLLDECSKYC